MGLLVLLVILTVLIVSAIGEDDKRSIAFVIDDTGSMGDDIDQVIMQTNQVFDAVINNNATKFNEFVLVRFNDPINDTSYPYNNMELISEVMIKTNNPNEFKKSLKSIEVHGGDDCPEMTMQGILTALKTCQSNSVIYVFTDAAAKDYNKVEEVKNLSQKKSIQVTFLLTGVCDDLRSENYLVYHKIADATSGMVFHLTKSNIDKVLQYIIESIKSQRHLVAQHRAPVCVSADVPFEVDSKTINVMVAVTQITKTPEKEDSNFSLRVVDSKDNDVESVYVVNLPHIKIIKLLESQPGHYKVILNCNNDLATHVSVTGTTSISFQHGFSQHKPTSMKETSTLPLSGGKPCLSIELDNPDGDVKLETVELIDVDGNVIQKLDLELVDAKQQLYTTDNIVLPDKMFKIKINGYTKSKEKVTRVGTAFIEPQKNFGEIDSKSPSVTIIGSTEIIIKSSEPAILKCDVKAYPKPDIVWESDNGRQFRPNIIEVDGKELFNSLLSINESTENVTYFCRASNTIGKNEAIVKVMREIAKKSPNVTIIGSNEIILKSSEKVILKCDVKAYPKPDIVWESDKGRQFRPNIIEVDGKELFNSLLSINESTENVTYFCRASNTIGKNEAFVKVKRKEQPPVIKKVKTKINVEEKTMIELPCAVIEGNPPPKIEWLKNQKKITDDKKYQILENNSLRFKAEKEDNSVFTCKAANHVGSDRIIFYVTVYAKPVIKNKLEGKNINIAENEIINLTCLAEGNPRPKIQWTRDDKYSNPKKYTTDRNILSFKVNTSDRGHYTCEAKNRLGSDSKSFEVNVYVPVQVNIPKITKITVSVGERLKLTCTASGYPQPKTKLMFISKDTRQQKQLHPPGDGSLYEVYYSSLEDSGLYVCSASNDYSSSNFTYTVEVQAPPSITDKWPKTYTAVKGDLALRIPCKAQGNPKPDITWTYNGLLLAETDDVKIIEDGTLILLKPDKSADGFYYCEARNYLKKDSKSVEVEILASPKLPEVKEIPKTFIVVEKPSLIPCNITHNPVDLVRWWKDGKVIQIGELHLENPSITDNGIYTCRVSNEKSSNSYHTEVVAGFGPRFISPEPTGPIQFVEGSNALLDCAAHAEPPATIIWRRQDRTLYVSSMDYKITNMKTKHIGVYKCILSNPFDEITREYRIKSGECRLSISNDFTGFQPLVFTTPNKWPELEIQNGFIIVPVEIPLLLRCPGSSFDYPGFEKKDKTKAVCIKDSTFDIEGKKIKFSELKCKKEIVAYAQTQNISCLSKRYSKFYTIGYKYDKQFRGVYDICFDTEDNVPVFSRHSFMRHNSKNVPTKELPWTNSVNHPHNFTQLYDPNQQIRILSSLLGKEFESSSCHFAKKQLIISRDVSPGLSQTSTYNYLNVMPHWVLCYKENWEEVENKVRALVLSREYSIFVWTGTSGRMRLPGQMVKEDVYLRDEFNNRQYVPLYLWKVIQDYEHGMIAIIQINLPNLTSDIALDYVKCTDICHEIEWLRNEEWHNVKKGYTFCCNIIEFERQFNFGKMFRGATKVLRT